MHIREVTCEEIDTYRRDGWVKLPGLVDRETIAQLRAQSEEILDAREAGQVWDKVLDTRGFLARDGIEPFRSLAYDHTLAGNARKLLERERLTGKPTPVRYLNDAIIRKRPSDLPTLAHEDHGGHGLDRVASLAVWIALDEIVPGMGGMRFLTGSHRSGPHGHMSLTDILDEYPGLTHLYSWSEQQTYQPGDATVHHSCTIHEAQGNVSDRTRWAMIVVYASQDALFRENPFAYHPIDDAKFPVLA